MALVDEELTGVIKGCFYDVQNEVGLGLEEEAYHQGLIRAFAGKGLSFRSKEPVPVMYRGRGVLVFEPDFLVEDRVVIEIKSTRESFAQEHYVQLFSYFKATRRRVGFLVNFGHEWVVNERLIYDEKPFRIDEQWDGVTGVIAGDEREQLRIARECLIEVAREFGFGYGEASYRKLLEAVVESRGMHAQLSPPVQPRFHNDPVGCFPCNCIKIGSAVAAVVLALKGGLERLDLSIGRSYLTNLGLPFGVVANFAKDRLQLHGLVGGSHR